MFLLRRLKLNSVSKLGLKRERTPRGGIEFSVKFTQFSTSAWRGSVAAAAEAEPGPGPGPGPEPEPQWKPKPIEQNETKRFFELWAHYENEVKPGALRSFLEGQSQFIEDVKRTAPCPSDVPAKDQLAQNILYNSPLYTQYSALSLLAINQFYSLRRHIVYEEEMDPEMEILTPSSPQEHQQLVNSLAWSAELMNMRVVLEDDMGKRALGRFGKDSWHLWRGDRSDEVLPEARLLDASLDSFFESTFSRHKMYPELQQLLLECKVASSDGSVLEKEMNGNFAKDRRFCSAEEFSSARKQSQGYSGYYFPIAAGAIINGLTQPALLDGLKEISLKIAEHLAIELDWCRSDPEYFRMKDFMGPVYAGPEREIADGHMSWTILKALEHGSPEQRQVLQESYGRGAEGSHVESVLGVYKELDLFKLISDTQIELHRKITEEIEELPRKFPSHYLLHLLQMSILRPSN